MTPQNYLFPEMSDQLIGGVAIRATRKGLRLTQREFGQLFGVHLQTVSHWEANRRIPAVATQVALLSWWRMLGSPELIGATPRLSVDDGAELKTMLKTVAIGAVLGWVLAKLLE